MSDVVNGAGGTAHKAHLDNVIVCGKTGTAQVVGDKGPSSEDETEDKTPEQFRDHGWFIAFAPKDHPQIAVACIIEHGGHGGSAAAPVIHDVLQRFFELYPPPPEPTDRERARRRGTRQMTGVRALMAAGDRRLMLHFDWTLFIIVAGAGRHRRC